MDLQKKILIGISVVLKMLCGIHIEQMASESSLKYFSCNCMEGLAGNQQTRLEWK